MGTWSFQHFLRESDAQSRMRAAALWGGSGTACKKEDRETFMKLKAQGSPGVKYRGEVRRGGTKCARANFHWLLRAIYMHFFPVLCSAACHWYLEIDHSQKMDTTDVGKCYQSGCKSIPTPRQSLNIYQYTTAFRRGHGLRLQF